MINNRPLLLNFISHQPQVADDVLGRVTLCFSADARRQSLIGDAKSAQNKPLLADWFAALTSKWSPITLKYVRAVEPFSKEGARALLAHLETQPDEVKDSIAAYYRLRELLEFENTLNRNQSRQLTRKEWRSRGISRHPVPIKTACPSCASLADASVSFRSGDNLCDADLASALVTCAHCDYSEDLDFTPAFKFSEQADYPHAAELESNLQAIVDWHGQQWFDGVRGDLLSDLGAWLANLEAGVAVGASHLRRAIEASQRTREPLLRGSTVWTVRLYGRGSFEPHSSVEANTVVPPARGARHYLATTRPLDPLLDDLSTDHFKYKHEAVLDPVAHWRPHFDELKALLVDALERKDAVRAAACACSIAFALDVHGLIQDVLFTLENPPEDVWLVAQKSPRTPRLRGPLAADRRSLRFWP